MAIIGTENGGDDKGSIGEGGDQSSQFSDLVIIAKTKTKTNTMPG